MIRRGLCFLILLLPLAAFGQDNAMKSAFDVASVKPSAPGAVVVASPQRRTVLPRET